MFFSPPKIVLWGTNKMPKTTINVINPLDLMRTFNPLRPSFAVKALNYFCKEHGGHKCLSWLFPINLSTYVMGLWTL